MKDVKVSLWVLMVYAHHLQPPRRNISSSGGERPWEMCVGPCERWILNEVKCCITFSLVANNLYFDFETLYHINEHRPWSWYARRIKVCAHRDLRGWGACWKMQIFQFSPRSLICHTAIVINVFSSIASRREEICSQKEFLCLINHGRGADINYPACTNFNDLSKKHISGERDTSSSAKCPAVSSFRIFIPL